MRAANRDGIHFRVHFVEFLLGGTVGRMGYILGSWDIMYNVNDYFVGGLNSLGRHVESLHILFFASTHRGILMVSRSPQIVRTPLMTSHDALSTQHQGLRIVLGSTDRSVNFGVLKKIANEDEKRMECLGLARLVEHVSGSLFEADQLTACGIVLLSKCKRNPRLMPVLHDLQRSRQSFDS